MLSGSIKSTPLAHCPDWISQINQISGLLCLSAISDDHIELAKKILKLHPDIRVESLYLSAISQGNIELAEKIKNMGWLTKNRFFKSKKCDYRLNHVFRF